MQHLTRHAELSHLVCLAFARESGVAGIGVVLVYVGVYPPPPTHNINSYKPLQADQHPAGEHQGGGACRPAGELRVLVRHGVQPDRHPGQPVLLHAEAHHLVRRLRDLPAGVQHHLQASCILKASLLVSVVRGPSLP